MAEKINWDNQLRPVYFNFVIASKQMNECALNMIWLQDYGTTPVTQEPSKERGSTREGELTLQY